MSEPNENAITLATFRAVWEKIEPDDYRSAYRRWVPFLLERVDDLLAEAERLRAAVDYLWDMECVDHKGGWIERSEACLSSEEVSYRCRTARAGLHKAGLLVNGKRSALAGTEVEG